MSTISIYYCYSAQKLTLMLPSCRGWSAEYMCSKHRTHELTVLGVTFNSSLSFSQHMQNLTAKAATSLYSLKTLKAFLLKAHGLQGRALWDVTQATRLAQITYAGPSWRGLKGCNVKSTPLWISSYWLPFPWRFTGFQWWVTLQINLLQPSTCFASTPSTTQTHWL